MVRSSGLAFGLRCRLQWRDRAGLSPASALRSPAILRGKLRRQL